MGKKVDRIWVFKTDLESELLLSWTPNKPIVHKSQWIEFRRVVKRVKKAKKGGKK